MLPQLVSTQVERPSLRQIFTPASTGSPRQDLYNHISGLPQPARLDFEEHTTAGNLIVRIEPDLGSSSEPEKETKIVNASASVDFPLPRGPMMQVSPRGNLSDSSARKPPLMSIESMNHWGMLFPILLG